VSPVHEVLAAAAAGRDGSDSVQAIADALYRVTDLPVVVEDRFGTPRAWSGTSQPEPAHGRRAHAELLREAQRHATPIRDRDRVIAVSQPHEKVLGTIALLAPANTAAETLLRPRARGAGPVGRTGPSACPRRSRAPVTPGSRR
jgi:hypothetical protein